jgi:hypothetical protein
MKIQLNYILLLLGGLFFNSTIQAQRLVAERIQSPPINAPSSSPTPTSFTKGLPSKPQDKEEPSHNPSTSSTKGLPSKSQDKEEPSPTYSTKNIGTDVTLEQARKQLMLIFNLYRDYSVTVDTQSIKPLLLMKMNNKKKSLFQVKR